MVTKLLIGQTEEIKVRCFRVTTSEGYCDCISPLDNLGVITMVTDQDGNSVPFERWEYFEFCIQKTLGLI